MITQPVELPAHCPHCGGAITMQMVDWPDLTDPDWAEKSHAHDTTWTCPYCSHAETIKLRGRLAWVTRRVAGRETDPEQVN